MFKKNGGFTLVELIVVIAILAILAGVAIPTYSAYIAKAEAAKEVVAADASEKESVMESILAEANWTDATEETN